MAAGRMRGDELPFEIRLSPIQGFGAFATRTLLQQDSSRLAGNRVVVYQFATRELSMGDWRLLGLPPS